jgi:hypothetical protein
MLGYEAYHSRNRMSLPETLDSKFSEVLAALRRIWSALKGRLVPARPVPVPVRVPRGR